MIFNCCITFHHFVVKYSYILNTPYCQGQDLERFNFMPHKLAQDRVEIACHLKLEGLGLSPNFVTLTSYLNSEPQFPYLSHGDSIMYFLVVRLNEKMPVQIFHKVQVAFFFVKILVPFHPYQSSACPIRKPWESIAGFECLFALGGTFKRPVEGDYV